MSAKKISDLSVDELKDYMKSTGEIHRYSPDSEAWRYAFKLFNKTYGDRLVMNCNKCVGKVHDWLKK